MKNNKIKLFYILSLISILFSCSEDDERFENVRNFKPTVSIDKVTASTVEGSPITFTLTLDKSIANKIDYKIEFVSQGSTGNFRDYVTSGTETTIGEGGFGQGIIGHLIEFPATASTITFTVTPAIDLLTEGNEKIRLRLTQANNGLGVVNKSSENIEINVSDFISSNVGVSLDYSQSFTNIHGTVFPGEYLGLDNLNHTYNLYDYDLFVYSQPDATGAPLNSNGATESSIELTEILASQPNGDYYVYVDQWASPPVTQRPKVPFVKTMKLTLSKYGTWTHQLDVPFNSSSTLSKDVIKITKVNNVYTVKDIVTNAVIISG